MWWYSLGRGNSSGRVTSTIWYCRDGDQVSAKIAFSTEANAEIEKFKRSNIYYINLSGTNGRVCSNEAIQAMYSMTKILDADISKITKEVSIIKRKK